MPQSRDHGGPARFHHAVRRATAGLHAATVADGYALADGGTGEIRFHDWAGALTRIARRPGLGGHLLTSDEKANVEYVAVYRLVPAS